MYIDVIEHEYDVNANIIDSDHQFPSTNIIIKSSDNEDDATNIGTIE